MLKIEPDYQAALDYLYSFVDYSMTRNLQFSAEKFILSRMIEFAHLLKDPQEQFPIIHVAGTKGKGSTCAFIASALKYAGYNVGFYSSPHLLDFCERIQINGKAISHKDVVKLVSDMKPLISKVEKLTTFEITTALAFVYFYQKKVDCAVIEVGMGGRLDATNIVKPLVTVITSVSLDHMAILGNTVSKIAREKAGIIKTKVPIVLAPQETSADRVITSIARQRSAPLIRVGKDVQFRRVSYDLQDQKIELDLKNKLQNGLKTNIEQIKNNNFPVTISIPLHGNHQVENAAVAFTVLMEMVKNGWKIDQRRIITGFSKVNWPGRFEIIRNKLMFLLDAAHNKDSAEKLARTVKEYFPDKKVILFFGVSEDKDITHIMKALIPISKEIIFTQSIHPRAYSAEGLPGFVNDKRIPLHVITPLEEAMRYVEKLYKEDDMILVTGSLFVVAAVKELLADNNRSEK